MDIVVSTFDEYMETLYELYGKKSELFFNDEDLKDIDEQIKNFKSNNTNLIDLPPEKGINLFEDDDVVFSAENWLSEEYRGCMFIPSDGSGCWADDIGYYWDYSDVFGHKPDWATKVVWFNK
ncbi:hypothetical protein NVP1084O_104 [Vibrio phage 1.084.O._10N.261.49.F5]|nr:hypothetical protein NVP1084O_104 [Vibrio phage 1.084.O._10N.261.49.F5]